MHVRVDLPPAAQSPIEIASSTFKSSIVIDFISNVPPRYPPPCSHSTSPCPRPDRSSAAAPPVEEEKLDAPHPSPPPYPPTPHPTLSSSPSSSPSSSFSSSPATRSVAASPPLLQLCGSPRWGGGGRGGGF